MDTVYLDRKSLLAKSFSAGLCDANGDFYGADDVICVSDVMKLPAAKVSPLIHAHWIKRRTTHVGYDGYATECSHCKTLVKSLSNALKFCPECGAKMDERTRYRYITCGLAKMSDPVCDFRLIGGTNMSFAISAIRICIPDDMVLKKDPSGYSTTSDKRPLKELDAIPIVRINGKFKPFPSLINVEVGQWDQVFMENFRLIPTDIGYLTETQFRNYMTKRGKQLCT